MGKRPRINKVEARMVNALDELAAYEDFVEDVLPILKKAIAEGWTSDQIEKHPKVQALMVARQISIALTDKDSSRALAAIRDARDRTSGKAIERKEIRTQIEQAPDEQIDAKLKTLLNDGAATDDDLH